LSGRAYWTSSQVSDAGLMAYSPVNVAVPLCWPQKLVPDLVAANSTEKSKYGSVPSPMSPTNESVNMQLKLCNLAVATLATPSRTVTSRVPAQVALALPPFTVHPPGFGPNSKLKPTLGATPAPVIPSMALSSRRQRAKPRARSEARKASSSRCWRETGVDLNRVR
jgi:hypothetical protein